MERLFTPTIKICYFTCLIFIDKPTVKPKRGNNNRPGRRPGRRPGQGGQRNIASGDYGNDLMESDDGLTPSFNMSNGIYFYLCCNSFLRVIL